MKQVNKRDSKKIVNHLLECITDKNERVFYYIYAHGNLYMK